MALKFSEPVLAMREKLRIENEIYEMARQRDAQAVCDAKLEMLRNGTGFYSWTFDDGIKMEQIQDSELYEDCFNYEPAAMDHPFPTSIIGRIGDELVVRGEAWNDLKELIKPLPIEHLLPEVHHTVEFDSSAAWVAVKALSRGS